LSIMSAAESITAFTSWLPNSRRMTWNPKQFGAPLEIRSKITQHFSTHCDAGSWTAV